MPLPPRHGARPLPRLRGRIDLRLRAVVAFNNDEVGDRVRLAHFDVGLVFGRTIAGDRGLIIGKFDRHVARTAPAFDAFELAGAHDKAAAIFAKDGGIGSGVRLVAFLIVHIDAPDPRCATTTRPAAISGARVFIALAI